MPDTETHPTTGPQTEATWSPITETWINTEWCMPAADTFLFEDVARGTFPVLSVLTEATLFGGTTDLPIFVPPDFLL